MKISPLLRRVRATEPAPQCVRRFRCTGFSGEDLPLAATPVDTFLQHGNWSTAATATSPARHARPAGCANSIDSLYVLPPNPSPSLCVSLWSFSLSPSPLIYRAGPVFVRTLDRRLFVFVILVVSMNMLTTAYRPFPRGIER